MRTRSGRVPRTNNNSTEPNFVWATKDGYYSTGNNGLPPKPRVEVIISESDNPRQEQKRVVCPTCKGTMSFTSAGMWFCAADLTTLNKLVDSLPGPNEEIQLGDNQEKPFFKNIGKPYVPQGRNTTQEDTVITGSYRKAHIKTTNLAEITEERLRKYFQAEESIY